MEQHRIREFRIVLPMEVEEYHVGQLWSVAEASKNETGGGEGVEVAINEPFDLNDPECLPIMKPENKLYANGKVFTKGQFTKKVYHLATKVPGFVRVLAPKNSLTVTEEAWNAYPYCRTIIKNGYMKENMYVIIETYHHPDNGSVENIHSLQGRDFKERKVIKIDIACDPILPKDYKPEWDPTKVPAPQSGRMKPLPSDPNWINQVRPVMCCYKLVKVYFKWFGFQSRMENFILTQEERLFRNFHRQVTCWQDNYHGMTMEDIRLLEARAKEELAKQMKEGPVRGTRADGEDK